MDVGTRYPMNFYRGFLSLSLIGLIFGTTWFVSEHGLRLNLMGLLFAYTGGAICASGFQFLLSKLTFVEVNKAGVAGSTFWGRRGFVHWDNIKSAQRYYIFPVGFVHVRTSNGSSSLWLPTHVKHQDKLKSDLLTLAPFSNPVRKSFDLDNET